MDDKGGTDGPLQELQTSGYRMSDKKTKICIPEAVVYCVSVNKACLKIRGQNSHTSLSHTDQGVLAYTFNPRTWETMADGSL